MFASSSSSTTIRKKRSKAETERDVKRSKTDIYAVERACRSLVDACHCFEYELTLRPDDSQYIAQVAEIVEYTAKVLNHHHPWLVSLVKKLEEEKQLVLKKAAAKAVAQ